MPTSNEDQAWIKRYYPEPAINFRNLDTKIPKREAQLKAAKHSLRKWVGLRRFPSRNAAPISVDADSCALCEISYSVEELGTDCQLCPLWEARCGAECDEFNKSVDGEDASLSPFHKYVTKENNPEVMIAWLRVVVRQLVRRQNPAHDLILPQVTGNITLYER